MPDTDAVSKHYSHGSLLDAIQAGIEGLGKTTDTISVEDLGPVEEFHIGGREASRSFLDQLEPAADDHVLDAGCGLGGTSRFVADLYGSRVSGIDLTLEYVETGRIMCEWVGLDHLVSLEHGSVTAMPFDDEVFDKAYVMHVGMNIEDKQSLISELHRVLKPGGRMGIYDVMRTGDGELVFPVPWASEDALSFLASPEEYRQALDEAGFRVVADRNRRDFALDFFARLQARVAEAGGPPPLGLHLLMGASAPDKIRNMVANIAEGRIAPVEIVAEKQVGA